jgi:hypothetical protein
MDSTISTTEQPKERPLCEGARLLRAYIDEHFNTSVQRFANERLTGLRGADRVRVLRALNGESKRFSVNFAAAIERATDGAVPVAAWETTDDPDDERPTIPLDIQAGAGV